MRFWAPATKLVVLDRLVPLLCFPAHGQGPLHEISLLRILCMKKRICVRRSLKDAPMSKPPRKNRSPNGCIWSKKLACVRLMQTFATLPNAHPERHADWQWIQPLYINMRCAVLCYIRISSQRIGWGRSIFALCKFFAHTCCSTFLAKKDIHHAQVKTSAPTIMQNHPCCLGSAHGIMKLGQIYSHLCSVRTARKAVNQQQFLYLHLWLQWVPW